jgi:hypothetical protein
VAGSGLIGRYIYARIHHGLYGSKLSLEELKTGAEGLRAHSGAFGFLPQLVSRLESTESKLLAAGPHLPVLGIAKLAVVALLSIASRWQLRSYVRGGLRAAAKTSPVIAAERKRLRRTSGCYTTGGGLSVVRAPVLAVACTSHPTPFHTDRRGNRPRDRRKRLLTACGSSHAGE